MSAKPSQIWSVFAALMALLTAGAWYGLKGMSPRANSNKTASAGLFAKSPQSATPKPTAALAAAVPGASAASAPLPAAVSPGVPAQDGIAASAQIVKPLAVAAPAVSAAPTTLAAEPVALSSASASAEGPDYNPKTKRDPTLSPQEQDYLEQLERERSKKPGPPSAPKKKKQRSPESMISVEGIIITDGGKSAIVNNKILKEGQSISGVKVVKIRESYVEFSAKGKKFKKVMKK